MDHSDAMRHSRRTVLVKIFEFFKAIIASEIKHRFNQVLCFYLLFAYPWQLGMLGIFPSTVVRIFNLVTQKYTGNVTIWPIPSFSEFINILEMPTTDSFRKGLLIGSRRTYPSNHGSTNYEI